MLFPLTGTKCAAAQCLPWYQIFIGLPWMLQWHQHGFAIHAFGNTVHDRGSLVSKAWLGCPLDVVANLLLFPMLCLFFLSLSPALALSSI